MRRTDRVVGDIEEIKSILRSALICRLAMSDGDQPYVVPLCFGYEGNALYFHSSQEGRKLDFLRKNSRVCFEVDVDSTIVESKSPCSWSMRYRSVIGFGKASFVDDPSGKREALDIIMRHYADPRFSGHCFSYPEDILASTAIIKVDIESMSGKKSRY